MTTDPTPHCRVLDASPAVAVARDLAAVRAVVTSRQRARSSPPRPVPASPEGDWLWAETVALEAAT